MMTQRLPVAFHSAMDFSRASRTFLLCSVNISNSVRSNATSTE